VTVIDASALAIFVLKEDGWKGVAEYLKAGTWSTDHVVKEVANAVWKRFKRGATSREEAEIMLKILKKITEKSVKIVDELEYMDEAIKITFNQNITIYDSIYIAIAKKNGLKLLTADKSQATAAKSENVEVILLT